MSAIDFDLYDANAFALAKCIYNSVSRSLLMMSRETDEKEIVLDKVMLEAVYGQCAIRHPLHKLVVCICLPWRLHVFSVQ